MVRRGILSVPYRPRTITTWRMRSGANNWRRDGEKQFRQSQGVRFDCLAPSGAAMQLQFRFWRYDSFCTAVALVRDASISQQFGTPCKLTGQPMSSWSSRSSRSRNKKTSFSYLMGTPNTTELDALRFDDWDTGSQPLYSRDNRKSPTVNFQIFIRPSPFTLQYLKR